MDDLLYQQRIEAMRQQAADSLQELIRSKKENRIQELVEQDSLEKYSKILLKPGRYLEEKKIDEALVDRDFISIANVGSVKHPTEWQRDWLTIGVLARKSSPKPTRIGKKFITFTFTDLENHEMTLNVFGAAYEDHWLTELGQVFVVLNAKPYETVFSLDIASCLILVGESVDYGPCRGILDNGPCPHYVNKKYGQQCMRHNIKYQKTKRLELTGTTTTVTTSYKRNKVFTKPTKPEQRKDPSREEKALLNRYLDKRNASNNPRIELMIEPKSNPSFGEMISRKRQVPVDEPERVPAKRLKFDDENIENN